MTEAALTFRPNKGLCSPGFTDGVSPFFGSLVTELVAAEVLC